jgi:hypothetical protein
MPETYLPRDGVMAVNAIAKLDRWRSKRARKKQREGAKAVRQGERGDPSGNETGTRLKRRLNAV